MVLLLTRTKNLYRYYTVHLCVKHFYELLKNVNYSRVFFPPSETLMCSISQKHVRHHIWDLYHGGGANFCVGFWHKLSIILCRSTVRAIDICIFTIKKIEVSAITRTVCDKGTQPDRRMYNCDDSQMKIKMSLSSHDFALVTILYLDMYRHVEYHMQWLK